MSVDQDVQELLQGKEPVVHGLVARLRKVVTEAVPEACENVKKGWKTITYENGGIVCYISPLKKHVDLGFYHGVDLEDPERLLEGHGKELRHIKIWKPEDIHRQAFMDLVRQAFGKSDNPGKNAPAPSAEIVDDRLG